MSLPFFYIPDHPRELKEFILDEDNSRHIVQVLRMKKGESLLLTDGKGQVLRVSILDDHKKKCRVGVLSAEQRPGPFKKVSIAVSLLKNTSRFEWLLEKATEIGVTGIVPLLCERTEKTHFRQDRLQSILISAMLQSQQAWLPVISEPILFKDLMREKSFAAAGEAKKYIAHCLDEKRLSLGEVVRKGGGEGHSLILIGPEGDFSKGEIEEALLQGYVPVTLGENRLRTETAGLVAATLLCIG